MCLTSNPEACCLCLERLGAFGRSVYFPSLLLLRLNLHKLISLTLSPAPGRRPRLDGPCATLYVAPAPPWLFPAASCSGALCRSDILLIHCSSSSGQQHKHTQSSIHQNAQVKVLPSTRLAPITAHSCLHPRLRSPGHLQLTCVHLLLSDSVPCRCLGVCWA